MKQRSKRYRALIDQAKKAGVDLAVAQPVPAAVGLVKQLAKAKFTEAVDIAIHLNLDTKKADQQFRGNFSLPHGTGRTVRVIAFVDDGDKIMRLSPMVRSRQVARRWWLRSRPGSWTSMWPSPRRR